MRLNTGLVSIITTFLNHEQKGTSGHMKMNYRSLTDLSEASRRDALTSMSQLYQRLSQSQLQIHPALRINAIESSGNSSDSSKDNRKSTASRGRRPSGSHVTRLTTKSSSQPQLCMVRSKSRNTSRKDSTSSSSSSKLASKSTSRSESPYASPLQSPVPEYAVLDPMMQHRVDMKSPIYTRRISASAQIPPFSPDRKRIDSLDAVAHSHNGPGVSTIALQHRLANLTMGHNDRPSRFMPQRQNSVDGRDHSAPHSSQHSSGQSTPHYSRTPQTGSVPEPSYFDIPTNPANYSPAQNYGSSFDNGYEYDMSALARTPSYNTAVRTPAAYTPMAVELPSYDVAMSRPGSPVHSSRHSSRGVSRATTPSPPLVEAEGEGDGRDEETARNTQMNSRRESPRHSGDGR